MSRYDFTDPLIREMVAEHHRPKEVPNTTDYGAGKEFMIVCRQCGQPWRCPSRKALGVWEEERWAETRAKLAEAFNQSQPRWWRRGG